MKSTETFLEKYIICFFEDNNTHDDTDDYLEKGSR